MENENAALLNLKAFAIIGATALVSFALGTGWQKRHAAPVTVTNREVQVVIITNKVPFIVHHYPDYNAIDMRLAVTNTSMIENFRNRTTLPCKFQVIHEDSFDPSAEPYWHGLGPDKNAWHWDLIPAKDRP